MWVAASGLRPGSAENVEQAAGACEKAGRGARETRTRSVPKGEPREGKRWRTPGRLEPSGGSDWGEIVLERG